MPRNDYAAAAYPEPWQILGLQLKPFSLGHYLKLRRLGCAFVAEDEQDAGLADLLFGALVCSMESDPNPDKDPFWSWFNRPLHCWQRWFPKVFGTLTPAERDVYKWGRKCRGVDFQAKAGLFNTYVQQHGEQPSYWVEKESAHQSGAHWSRAVLTTLVSKCGYTQVEAYNVGLSKALSDFFRWAEGQGHITLMTAEEAAISGA